MTRGIIFDYGGTLDTAGCHWGKVLWRAYQQKGVPVNEKVFREAYVHAERTLGRNPIIQPSYTFERTLSVKLQIELDYLVEQNHLNMSEEELKLTHKSLLDSLYEGVKRETNNSRQVLEKLKERHEMVLVSNFYGNIGVVLEEFGLSGLFSSVIESAVVGVRKPAPRIFTLGVEALCLQPNEVTVVGDSFDKDIIPAKQAGCHTVWFKGEGWTDEAHDETLPNRIITTLNQLL